MRSSTPPDTVHVTVRLFSVLRHRDGRIVDRLEMDLARGSRARDVLHLLRVDEELEAALALNDALVAEDAILSDGDILSIIPAVAGG
jgi:molybdopterin converting factor small subunit